MAIATDTPHPPATGANDTLHRVGITLRGVVAIALGVFAIAERGYSTALVGAFVAALRDLGARVETGVFGAKMLVSLVNDGPVTLILEA